MANFEYPFTSAGTPVSFAIGGSGVTGIDEAGTLTVKVVKLGSGMDLVVTGTVTTAQLAAAMLAWLAPRGYANTCGGPTNAPTHDGTVTPATTEVAAAD